MKKLLLGICVLLASSLAHAGGKLMLQNNLYDHGKTYRPMIGLNVNQPIFKWLGSNVWVGYGNQPLEDKADVNWFVGKAEVDFYLGKWTVAPGVQYKFVQPYAEKQLTEFVKIERVLW